jgi:small subunit ribosomal protein S16
MVKIRLRRVGAKNKPMYRIVVADSRSPRDGAFIEVIGHYNPLTDPETLDLDKEKAIKWLGCGAKPTDTVARLLVKSEVPMKSEFKPSMKQKTSKSKSKSTPASKPEASAPVTETTAKET